MLLIPKTHVPRQRAYLRGRKGISHLWKQIYHWERWPKFWFFVTLSPAWTWFCLKNRSFWFFTATNPGLTFGGFEGEGKREMYAKLPEGSYPKTHWFLPGIAAEQVLDAVRSLGFAYPLFAKPEVGMSGIFCHKIRNEAAMRHYHERCPVEYMVQSAVDYPMEIGVFYIRYPGQASGRISGMTQKVLPFVVGDGLSTVAELMAKHPFRHSWPAGLFQKNAEHMQRVLPAGAEFLLADAANRTGGARLLDLGHLVDAQLTAVFDRLSHHAGDFYYGRFDVKCASLEALRAGQAFSIMEFNGAGAAIHHIYHRKLSFRKAWWEVVRHWQEMSDLCRINRGLGVRVWGFWEGLVFLRRAKRHFRHLEAHDK